MEVKDRTGQDRTGPKTFLKELLKDILQWTLRQRENLETALQKSERK